MTESTIAGIRFLPAPSAAAEAEAEPEPSPVDKAIRENRVRFEARVSELREDRDLSDEAKRRHMEEAYTAARARHERLAAEKQAAIAERLETARRAAFAPPRIRGADPAMLSMSYRDALDRAQTRDTRELEDLLERAEITGDEVLAKAILLRGYQREDERLVGRYLENRPEERRRWDEFMDAAQEANAAESVNGRLLSDAAAPRRPREIGGDA